MPEPGLLDRLLPATRWLRGYRREAAAGDLTAAVIVTLMLVPQALAYAMLAGMPPQMGLYASMLPLLLYALFGTSSTLAVGPVAVAALMTASAVAPFAAQGVAQGVAAAITLATLSGLMLLLAGLLRFGQIANFLSHPVIAGFISAASVIIAASQVPTLLGFSARGETLPELLRQIAGGLSQLHAGTVLLSAGVIACLLFARSGLKPALRGLGVGDFAAGTAVRAVPALLVLVATLGVHFGWGILDGVRTVGTIPGGLPALGLPAFDLDMWRALALPALFITLVGYVESISVAESLGIRRRERIDPDRELVALGVANLGSAVSGGVPVCGGVSRSVVNADAGAITPAAGLFTAIGMALATVSVAGMLGELPRFVLAATIVVAVLGLFDAGVFSRTWRVSRKDFWALLITFGLTLLVNVEVGIGAGVLLSVGLHLYRSSRPHTAIVGRVHGTEHFRNVDRHAVDVCPQVVTLRVDESLYFANARFLEERVLELVASRPDMKHLVLMCPAVNDIDASAIETLETINRGLREAGIGFHLSEVKGPVMDLLERSELLQHLNGQVFLTQFKAYEALSCLQA
jgi:SulP family sulfate permease